MIASMKKKAALHWKPLTVTLLVGAVTAYLLVPTNFVALAIAAVLSGAAILVAWLCAYRPAGDEPSAARASVSKGSARVRRLFEFFTNFAGVQPPSRK